MTAPLFGSLYTDVPATGIAVRRMQSDGRFIAMRMVPRMLVLKPSGTFHVFNSGDLNRDEMAARGPSAPAQKAGWRRSTQTFSTDARSLEYDLNDAEAAGADVETNPEVTIPQVLAYKALLHLERRMSSKFFTTGVWYRTITGAVADSAGTATAKDRLYLDNTSADPIEAFTDEIRILSQLTGADPKEMGLTFGARLWHKVRNHAKVKSQIVGVAGGSIGASIIAMARQAELEEFAKLLGIKWCAVSTAIYNAAIMTADPTDEPDNQLIVPQDEALLYVNPVAGEETANAAMSPSTLQPPAFCRPVWNGVAGVDGEGVQVRKMRDEKAGPGGSWANIIDVYNGFEVVTARCGVRFAGMVTP
jgi:hypothetical protein